MVPDCDSTKVYILQTDTVLQSTLQFPPDPTKHQPPQSPKHHQPRPTKGQEPPHTKMVMGSIPGCGSTPSIPQSDNPQSATRIKDYFRRSQVIIFLLRDIICRASQSRSVSFPCTQLLPPGLHIRFQKRRHLRHLETG